MQPSRNVSPELDLIPGNLKWADAGRALTFETGVRGEAHLFRVDVKDGKVKQVTTGARAVRSVDTSDRARRMVYAANDFKHLDDLYVADADGGSAGYRNSFARSVPSATHCTIVPTSHAARVSSPMGSARNAA